MAAPITEADVKRIFKGMREAGVADGRVVIEKPDGTKVSIISGKSEGEVGDEIDKLIDQVPEP